MVLTNHSTLFTTRFSVCQVQLGRPCPIQEASATACVHPVASRTQLVKVAANNARQAGIPQLLHPLPVLIVLQARPHKVALALLNANRAPEEHSPKVLVAAISALSKWFVDQREWWLQFGILRMPSTKGFAYGKLQAVP